MSMKFKLENRSGIRVLVWESAGCRPATTEECEMWDHIAQLEQRIAEMEGDGYVTAAECLDDWWNQSNVQGIATMSGEELLFIREEFLSYGKDAQPAPTDEHCAWTVEDPRQQEGSGNE